MLAWIYRQLRPPAYEDEDKAHTAALLNAVLWSMLPLSTSFLALSSWRSFVLQPQGVEQQGAGQQLIAPLVVITMSVVGLLLLRRGFVRSVSLGVTTILWLNVTFVVLSSGTIRLFPVSTYVVAILAGGLLLGSRAAVILAGLSLLSTSGIALAEHYGLLVERPIPSLVVVWSALAGTMVMATVLLVLALNNLHRALQRDRELNRDLRHEIQRRRLAEEERERMITELQEKSADIERFTYGVSHDLKSPLFTIQGYLGILASAIEDPDLLDDLQQARDAASVMRGRLNSLMALSQAGALEFSAHELPFAELAGEAVDLVAGRLQEHDVEVVIRPNLPSVTGDRDRLVQVLQNLVENAAKYMGSQSQPRIEIGARGSIFFVRDNGMGLAPENLEKVFALFTRLSKETEGAGIGLAHVRRVIEAHGGRIWVESDGLGQGATFCFTIPSDRDITQPVPTIDPRNLLPRT